jgi:photosystem II stability/assembly factor-like uncharacterized protein
MLASRDGGQTWSWTGPDLGEGMAWRVITFAAADPGVVYAGSGAYYSAGGFSDDLPAAGIYASRDGGETWEAINTDLTAAAQIAELAVHPEFVGYLYAASTTDGLLRSYDGGLTWDRVTAGLPEGGNALSVAFDPHGPDAVLAGFAGQGLYRSTDGGERWVRAAAGFNPESTITDIAFDPVASGTVYASDIRSGVYRSEDAGETWAPLGSGLRTRAVNGLAISGDGAHLYAATEGEGVYRLDLEGGAPQPAAPLWEPEPPTTEPGPSSETTVPPATTESAGTQPATTEPGGTAPATTTAASESAIEGDGGFPWLPIGILGAVAATLLGALVVVRRRHG